jgi:hypothetical protein
LRIAEAVLRIGPHNRNLGVVLKRVLGLLLSDEEEVVYDEGADDSAEDEE